MNADASIRSAIRKLTPVQRRVLLSLPDDGTFTDAYSVCKQRNTRMALNNLGVTEPKRSGAFTAWWLFRPSPLGKEVRARLSSLTKPLGTSGEHS